MALRNYNVNDNAVVASSAGLITAGYAVCTTPSNTGYVVASTVNRAAIANGWISGIAIGAGVSGAAIPIVNSGHVDASYVGTIGGSGDYVNVQSDGSLVRASSATADTVGHYEDDGGVWVNLGLQAGGAVTGNATAIQGVSVTSASATRSNKLTGDGTNLRFRDDMPDFRDWSPAMDGATDDSAKLQSFFDAVGEYGTGRLAGSNIYIANPVVAEDATDAMRGIHIFGDYAEPFTPTAKPGLILAVPCPTGAAATLTSATNGGSGQYMQTWTLGSGSSTVTAANADKFIGRRIRLWNTTAKAHTGVLIITSVPSDGVVTVYNPNTGATTTDASNGSIYWRIYLPALRICQREFRLERLSLTSPAGTWGPMLEIAQSPRAGAVSVINWALDRVAFWVDQYTKNPECGLLTAQDIVPRSGNAHYTTNGAGVAEVYATTQVDTGDLRRCIFYALDNGWKHYSKNGQSKEITATKCQFAQALRNYGGYGGNGYVIPRETFASGGTYSTSGSGHVNFYHCSFAALSRAIQIGGGTSPVTIIEGCMFESTQRLFRSSAGTAQIINFIGCTLHPISTSSKHPSQEIFESLDDGPLNFIGCNFMQSDSAGLHGVFTSNSGKRGHVSFWGCWFKGTTGWTGRRGRVTARLCGPYKFTSGDIGTFAVDGGANQNVTVTAANMTAAGLTGVDLNEVTSWQLGRLIDYSLTGAVAWGEYDEAPPVVETSTEGTGGRIEYISGAGGWALVDFPTGVQTGFVQTTLSSMYGGWIDCSRSSGSGAEPLGISVHTRGNIVAPFTYSSTHTAWPEGTRSVGTTAPKPQLASVGGDGDGANITAVTGGVVTVAGAVMTVADTAITARSIVTIVPTNAAAVTLGTGFLSARTAGTSFAFTFPGAPAGTETYLYAIQEPA